MAQRDGRQRYLHSADVSARETIGRWLRPEVRHAQVSISSSLRANGRENGWPVRRISPASIGKGF